MHFALFPALQVTLILASLVSSGPSLKRLGLNTDSGQSWADGDQPEDKTMTSLRRNDHSDIATIVRSERLYNAGGLWYFRTREGHDIGPFRYESEANQMLTQYVEDMQAAERLAEIQPDKPHFRMSAIGVPL